MKNSTSYLRFTTISLITLFFVSIQIAGCDKPCSDVTCENGGICVDGTCDCPAGFTGQFCEDTLPPAERPVRAWINVDAQGNPVTIGIGIPEEELLFLPSLPDFHSILLPAASSTTLFNHVFWGWVPHGHGPFWVDPHFDIHFMMMSNQERENITSGTDPNPLGASYIPQDYLTGGEVIPQMGVHWYDPTSPELNGSPFTATMIYGSYQGQINFVEPMITLAYLQTRPSATFNIKQPAKYQLTGYWPTTYSVKYKAASTEFEITIEGFVFRMAS